MFLTSAPWDRLLFLRNGEGSADRRGVRPPFFNCSPEGDFGTVHTGTPSEETTRLVNNSEEEIHGVHYYLICSVDLCVLMLDFELDETDNKNEREPEETTHITLSYLTFNIKVLINDTELRVCY